MADEGHKLWKVSYSYHVKTSDMQSYRQNMQWLIVAKTDKEALKKSDRHFISLDEIMNRELLETGNAAGGGAELHGLRKAVEEYSEQFSQPELTLESDRQKFSLKPKLSDDSCLRYKVTKHSKQR